MEEILSYAKLQLPVMLNVIGGILFFVLMWILALFFRKMAIKLAAKLQLDRKVAVLVPEEQSESAPKVGNIFGSVIFWLFFLVGVVGTMHIWRLGDASEPLKKLLSRIFGYLPNLLAAGAIVLVAALLAKGVRYGSGLLMQYMRLDEKIEQNFDTDNLPSEVSSTVSTILYYFVWLCFFPAIIGALEIRGFAAPFERMFEKLFTFLPNIFAAVLILVVGLVLAKLLRNFVRALLGNSAVVKIQGKIGMENREIAKPVSIIVYILAAIPVFAAAFQALSMDVISSSVGTLVQNILDTAGNLFAAALIVFAFYIFGSFAAAWAKRIAAELNIKRFFSVFTSAENPGRDFAADALEKLVFAGVLFIGVLTAFDFLGFTSAAQLMRDFIPFAGKILLALAVFLAGIPLGNYVAGKLQGKSLGSSLIPQVVRYAVIFLFGAMALHCTGISSPIVFIAFTLILGTVALATALAFGLGGRESAAKKLDEWLKK